MAARSLASGFTQVSYVVPDIEVTSGWFKRALGVEFFAVREIDMGGGGYQLTAGGNPVAADLRIKLAIAKAGARGELEIELIQPAGGHSLFSKFVQRTGGGLHHVAFETDDFDAATQPLQYAGIIPRATTSGASKIAYFDCRAAGASIVEVAQWDRSTWMENQRYKYPPGTEPAVMVASAPAAPDTPRFVQISYTVRDLDAVTQWFKQMVGVEHFGITKAVAGRDYEVKVRDEPVTSPFSLRTAMGRLGPRGEQEIEIIEPGPEPSIYREFLERNGEGLNHVSFLVPDYESAAQRIRATGMKPLIEFIGHGIHSCYFDCRAVGASIVEIAYFDEKATASLERVKTPREKRAAL